MDYLRIYESLIHHARANPPVGYKERHHIVPKCLGGDNSVANLVDLSARQHFLAHQLLVKIHPKSRGLSWALLLMCGRLKQRSRQYAWAKKKAAEHISLAQRGQIIQMTEKRLAQYRAQTGKPLSEEHRAKLSASNKGKKRTEEQKKKQSEDKKNNPSPLSTEGRERLRDRMKGNSFSKGVKHSPEVGVNASERLKGNTFRRGKKASEKTRRKISEGLKGRAPTEATRSKIAAAHRTILDDQIRGVRADSCKGFTQKEIGLRNGVSTAQVGRILRNEKYMDIK